MATRSERELEKSLARAQQYGSWRRELNGPDILPGEPRAAFSAHDAAQVAMAANVTIIPPKKPRRKRHVKVGVRVNAWKLGRSM